MKPQVLTRTTSGVVPSEVSSQPAAVEPRGELLGVDLVAGAAERDQVDGAGRGTSRHTQSLPQGTACVALPSWCWAEAERHRHRAVGVWRWPFTVSDHPAGVAEPDVRPPSARSRSARIPPGSRRMKSCAPSPALVSRTQQSSVAVSWIATLCVGGRRRRAGRGLGAGRGLVRRGRHRLAAGPPPSCDTSRYAPNPTIGQQRHGHRSGSGSGERRSRILIGVAGSNTSAALIVPGGPCSASYVADQRDRDRPRRRRRCCGCARGRRSRRRRRRSRPARCPDDRFPDPGLVADLADGETGLTAGFRQAFADAHAAPPRARCRCQATRRPIAGMRGHHQVVDSGDGPPGSYPPRRESSSLFQVVGLDQHVAGLGALARADDVRGSPSGPSAARPWRTRPAACAAASTSTRTGW